MPDNHVLAEQDYLSGMKYQEIADKYEVSINTVKSWKQRYGWNRKKGAHKPKSMHTNKGGAPPGNQNAKGNKGGPGGPRGNNKAVTHGFYRKYFPDEALEIMEHIAEQSPLDMLWDNIVIQYTAIIRAQQIMYVRDRDDKTVEKIEEKGGNVSGERWEVQQAWDKQATFLSAQSRAMSELRAAIKQFVSAAPEEDERREKLELMRLQVDKTKLDIEKTRLELKDMRGENDNDPHELGSSYAEALNAQAEQVFADEVTDDAKT